MKKNFILISALCLTLAASILTMGACKSTGDNGDTTSASGDEQAAPVYYTDVPGSVKKSETVYVNMDNSGDVKDITVTDWLHTDKGQVKVSDTSSLKNITNVKSNIKPVSENGGITWHMDTTDLYYSGKSNKELPVKINIKYFLDGIIPTCEEVGVKMACHPDDPGWPIFGLPRVITCEENIDRYLAIVDSPANTMCLCTGSLGCSPKNDIPKLVRKYSAMKRIGFMHIRNVKILPDTSFEESGHLTKNGSLDMNAIVKALVETGFDGYFRPDHGRMIWSEVGSSAKPGYGLYDRALGSAYINGLIEANGGVIE